MLNFFKKALDFLRITDDEGKVSLTNLGVIIILAKVGISSECNMSEIVALMGVLLNYSWKKFIKSKEPVTPLEIKDNRVDNVVSDVKGLEERISKDVNELKDRLSAVSIRLGISRKE